MILVLFDSQEPQFPFWCQKRNSFVYRYNPEEGDLLPTTFEQQWVARGADKGFKTAQIEY